MKIDPAVNRNRALKCKFGIDLWAYTMMLKDQGFVCALCGREERVKDKSGKVRGLSVDHDHKTGKVRGLLCHDCNTGLGKMQDSPELLRKAAEYLERNRGTDEPILRVQRFVGVPTERPRDRAGDGGRRAAGGD